MRTYEALETLCYDVDQYLQIEASGEDIQGLLSDIKNLQMFLEPLAPVQPCFKFAKDLVSDLTIILPEFDDGRVQRQFIRHTLVTLARYLHLVNQKVFMRKATKTTLDALGI